MTPANRRLSERFPFSSRLEVRRQRASTQGAAAWDLSDAGTPQPSHGIAFDVSVGGFGFRSPTPLAVGDVIEVSLLSMERELRNAGDTVARTERSTEPMTEPEMEIRAVVRHVSRDADTYVIGAERYAQ